MSFNIFEHDGFVKYVKEATKVCKDDKECFADRLKSELMYFYWSKSEYEIILSPWCGGDAERDSIKIDVYNQVMLNWNIFKDYVWEHREELLNLK
jgi:hypothetical protein